MLGTNGCHNDLCSAQAGHERSFSKEALRIGWVKLTIAWGFSAGARLRAEANVSAAVLVQAEALAQSAGWPRLSNGERCGIPKKILEGLIGAGGFSVDRPRLRVPLAPTQSIICALRFIANPALIRGEAVSRISSALGLFVILSAASASAADFPVRKAGLWQITIAGAHSVKVRQCSNAASDEAMAQAGIGLPGDCAKHDVQESGSTITIDSVCKSPAGKTTTSHIVIIGSLESKYTMTMSSQAQKKPVTLYAEWLGPCSADQKPGDVIMPDGMKINLLAADRRGPAGR